MTLTPVRLMPVSLQPEGQDVAHILPAIPEWFAEPRRGPAIARKDARASAPPVLPMDSDPPVTPADL